MKIHLTEALQRFARQRECIHLSDTTAGKVLTVLKQEEPELASALLNENGELKPYVQLFINESPLRAFPADIPVTEADDVQLLSSLVGG